MKSVAVISLWRNDMERGIRDRMERITEMAYGASGVASVRFIWVVGNCSDETEGELRRFSREEGKRFSITIVRYDAENPGAMHTGEASASRLIALSKTWAAGAREVDPVRDDYVLSHESDLVSPHDIIPRMLATGLCPLAVWPVLDHPSCGRLFYDIWAYRSGGKNFTNDKPYHSVYRDGEPFEVDSAGSVLLFHAEDAAMLSGIASEGMVEISAMLKAEGRKIWVDPRIVVVQPTELWP